VRCIVKPIRRLGIDMWIGVVLDVRTRTAMYTAVRWSERGAASAVNKYLGRK
jgi:hypothetical protein